MKRTEVISHIRKGGSITNSFVGHEQYGGRIHTYDVNITLDRRGRIRAQIVDDMMFRTYTIFLSPKQLRTYIRLHY